ncbi:PREDICTED: GDSL esterase/lipase At3g27950-like [Lupinus angustifolius]|uniref:GDSL esterase/lipase At3g27950-like n=1 Tax=Lupinus angustifolius TaxID=3871 RepID=UPI00092EAADB|nr:PREDICTED: GDSL esterase/lipase At3g27950-like [Lupinus angustifolius]
MDSKRASYIVGCFVFGLIGLLIEVRGENVLPKCFYSAIYNFGDSNSDTGTTSSAYTTINPPNGELIPGLIFPTRNCDGRLIIDFITQNLKLPYVNAYLDSIGSTYKYGANFATGGAPIVKGPSPFNLALQISQFIQFKSRVLALYKGVSFDPIVRARLPNVEFNKALYTIDIGQLDLAYGLFTSNNDYQAINASIPSVLGNFSQGVQQLYNEGARFFWIHNTGSWGCVPRTNKMYKPTPEDTDSAGCRISENKIAQEFNKQLKDLIVDLRKKFPDAKFTYVDIYSAKYELTKNAKSLGFADPMEFCCGTIESPIVDCGVNTKDKSRLCNDPSKYITWDGIHYSEAANKWVASRIINGSLSDPPLSIDLACHSS